MVMITVVAAFMMTMNFLASADTLEMAMALGDSRVAGQDVDVVAGDQLLRQPGGDVGCHAAGVLADDLDLLAGNGVALLLHVELDAVVHLRRKVGELARERHDHADLDRALRRAPCPAAASNASAAAPLRIDRLSMGFLLRQCASIIASCCQGQGWARLPVGRLLRSARAANIARNRWTSNYLGVRACRRGSPCSQALLKPASTSGGMGAERSRFLSLGSRTVHTRFS